MEFNLHKIVKIILTPQREIPIVNVIVNVIVPK